jgi:hypothetical protein
MRRVYQMCATGVARCNVPHALTAHSGAGYFDTAFITGDAFVTGVLVFTAITLPIAGGAKDGFTEQARPSRGAGGDS